MHNFSRDSRAGFKVQGDTIPTHYESANEGVQRTFASPAEGEQRNFHEGERAAKWLQTLNPQSIHYLLI